MFEKAVCFTLVTLKLTPGHRTSSRLVNRGMICLIEYDPTACNEYKQCQTNKLYY
jgi:hypothetical protein